MSDQGASWEPLGAALARLVAPVAEEAFDASAYANERFARWLAAEAAAMQTLPERRASDAAARAFAERMRGRILAAAAGVPVLPLRVSDEPRGDGVASGAASGARLVPWLESSAVAAGAGREVWDEPCERWVVVPRDVRRDLPRDLPRTAIAVSVNGDSMTPLLQPKDVVVVRVGAPVRRGAIVVARHPDRGWVVKRVHRVSRGFLELESLNAAYAPFTIVREPGAVLGVVVAILRRS